MTGSSMNISSTSSLTVEKFSETLYKDMTLGTNFVTTLQKDGTLLVQSDLATAGQAATINLAHRPSPNVIIGDDLKRPHAVAQAFSSDKVEVEAISFPIRARLKGSMTQQRVAFDIAATTMASIRDTAQNFAAAAVMNVAAGNTATTITYDGVAFAGTQRKAITGFGQLASAPTSSRFFFAGTHTTEDLVQGDSTAIFSLQRMSRIRTSLTTQVAGQDNFPTINRSLNGLPYVLTAYIPQSVLDRANEATPSGLNLPNIRLSQIQGGQSERGARLSDQFVWDNVRYVVVPDHMIPNGIAAGGTALANVKRIIIAGAEGVALVYGNSGNVNSNGESIFGFTMRQDQDTIENEAIYCPQLIAGSKKIVSRGVDRAIAIYSVHVA